MQQRGFAFLLSSDWASRMKSGRKRQYGIDSTLGSCRRVWMKMINGYVKLTHNKKRDSFLFSFRGISVDDDDGNISAFPSFFLRILSEQHFLFFARFSSSIDDLFVRSTRRRRRRKPPRVSRRTQTTTTTDARFQINQWSTILLLIVVVLLLSLLFSGRSISSILVDYHFLASQVVPNYHTRLLSNLTWNNHL